MDFSSPNTRTNGDFSSIFESATTLDEYYIKLNQYLKHARGWCLKPIDGDTQDGLVSHGYYYIVDVTGKTLGMNTVVGKIKREYHIDSNTLVLDHISAAFDSTGLKRIRGLGIVDTVYKFDVLYASQHNIQRVVIDAVSSITKRKFTKAFADAGYSIQSHGNKTVASKA